MGPLGVVKALANGFAGDLSRAYLIASPERLVDMSGAEAPNVGARGGEVAGIPAVPSAGIGGYMALVQPGAVRIQSLPL